MKKYTIQPEILYVSVWQRRFSDQIGTTATSMAEAPINEFDKDDKSCMPCRITGTVTFTGISAWLMHERAKIPVANTSHRATLAVMSVAFAGGAIARWFM